MVLHNCFVDRQQLVEMAAPSCRIFAGSKFANLCPIKNVFDPATNATCRFWLASPKRLFASVLAFQYLEDKRRVDRAYRKFANDRVDVGFECRSPLFAVDGILPGRFVRFNVGDRAFLKCRATRRFYSFCRCRFLLRC